MNSGGKRERKKERKKKEKRNIFVTKTERKKERIFGQRVFVGFSFFLVVKENKNRSFIADKLVFNAVGKLKKLITNWKGKAEARMSQSSVFSPL